MMRIRNRQKGFTLIELLIVVAIIGIIAAILIPNFLDALHKGRQKRTMGDIRQFGTALGAYYTDISGAAAAGQATGVDVTQYPGGGATAASIGDLETALVDNHYMSQLPKEDGWGNTMEYYVALIDPPRSMYAAVRSLGRDDAITNSPYIPGSFHPTDYDQDIVWADGGFVRAPSGAKAATAGGGGT